MKKKMNKIIGISKNDILKPFYDNLEVKKIDEF